MKRLEAIEFVGEADGIIELMDSGFVWIEGESIGMPNSPNVKKKAKELIKKFNITKEDLLKLKIIEKLK